MARLIVFGVPQGFDDSNCDLKTHNFLMSFYAPHKPGIQMKVFRRPGNEIHYVFLVYENPGSVFLDANGRSGSFFGMSIVLDNKYIGNKDNVYKLFQETYDKHIKNQIIIENNSVRKHKYAGKMNAIHDYILKNMIEIMKNNPELNFTNDYHPLPPPQNQPER